MVLTPTLRGHERSRGDFVDGSGAGRPVASPAVPAQPALAQGDAGPVWSKRLQLADGRTFITDGAFAVDASITSFKDLSKLSVVPGAVLDRYVQAPYTNEYSASDLNSQRGHYSTPDGMLLNSRYVDYLRQNTTLRRLRFRVSGEREPVVVVLDGRAIAVLMPMAQ